MKKLRKQIICFAITAVTLSGAHASLPTGVNVLGNSGFEDATIAPWGAQNGSTLSLSSVAQTGLQSAQVDFTADFHGIEQTLALDAGDALQEYTLTASVNTEGYTDPFIVRLGLWEFTPSSGITFHDSAWVNVTPGSSGWVDLSYTVTLTAPTADALRSVVQCAPQGSPKLAGHFLVDDVSLIKAIHATPFPTIYTNLITTVTTSAETPMLGDVRRPMAAGYYDATAEKTFISFTGAGMEPYVAAYDHGTNAWSTPVGIGILDSSTDNHDYSHIFPSYGDGRVQVTYSRHNQSLWIASSANPGSIGGTWNVREIGNNLGATYPMPMPSTDGSISILYRETKSPSDYRPMNLVRSTDNGATWSAPTPAIDYNNSRSDRLNEIYLGGMSYEANHPSAALGEGYHGTWTLAGGGDHDDYHKNMYYAFFQMSDQHWYAADGTDLGTNITDTEAEAHAKVFDSGALVGNKELGQTQDIGYTSKAVLNSDGNPVVVFQNGKTGNLDIGIWDGTQWSVTTPTALVGQKNDLRDLARVGDEVWLLERNGAGTRELQLMDDGQWETIGEFTPPSYSPDNYFIDNAQPEVFILAVDDNLGEGGGVYSVDVDVSLTVPVVAGDLDKDGFVTMNDVDLANSYLDGTIDGGDDAVTRQDAEIANGNTAAEALALLNLIDFDIDGDDTFDAADVTALEALVEPLMLGTAGMDGSGNFEVDVSGMTPGTTHYLKRSTDLVDGAFDTTVDTLTPASAAATMTDTNPPAGAAFYKVTD